MSQYRPLLPRSGEQSAQPPQRSSRKRRGPACEPCRKKRTACDGVRPTCSSCQSRQKACHFATQDNSETRLQALQREHKAHRDLVEHLRTAPAITAQAILHELRVSKSLQWVLHRFETGQLLRSPSELSTVLSTLPRVHSEAELKLMVRYPVAYPALNLSYNSIMSKKTLVDSLQVSPAETGIFDNPTASGVEEAQSTPEAKICCDDHGTALKQDVSKLASTCAGALETHLQVEYWTSVSVTNCYVAGALSTYLVTDHPMLRLFDTEAFLNDLLQKKSEFCSAFLVNSLLALASQTYSRADPLAASKSLEFEREARLLWRADAGDSLPNLAGLILLSIAMATNGTGGQGTASYIFEAVEMAKRLQLFGVHDRITSSDQLQLTEQAQYAFRQTTWGVFNVLSLSIHHWVISPISDPPDLSIPDKPDAVTFNETLQRFERIKGKTTPDDEAYISLCKLCRTDLAALIMLRDPDLKVTPPPAFAFSRYRKLLDLLEDLPESVRHVDKAPGPALFFHMCFHRYVMDLFRPYIVRGKKPTSSFGHSEYGTPGTIFQASTKQLKSLVVEYSALKNFSHGMMWHPTLLYTATGVLEFAPSDDWRFFFLLCIHCYAALYDAYTFAESAIQSLLTIALDYDYITKNEVVNILESTLYRKEKYRRTKICAEGRSAGMRNSKLTMSEHERRATEVLLKKLQNLSIFEQFSEVVIYGMKEQRAN